MKPVHQTIFEPPRGNCLQACIASLFEIDLGDVPNFMYYEDSWNDIYTMFLKDEFNIRPVMYDANWYQEGLDNKEHADWFKEYGIQGYHLIIGTSPRTKTSEKGYHHCVIGYDLEIVFDPFPNSGLLLKDSVVEHVSYEFFVLNLVKSNEHLLPYKLQNFGLERLA